MKKHIKSLLFLSLVIGSTSLCLESCNDNWKDSKIDLLELEKTQQYIKLTASAKSNKIVLNINSDEELVGNDLTEVYMLKGYEYFQEEKNEDKFFTGLSESFVEFDEKYKVGDYTLGSNQTIELNRFDSDGYDNLYSKFYVVRNNKIIKGSVFVTEVDPLVNSKPILNIKSKKGLFGEDYESFKDLNCSYTVLNLDLNGFIYPNEVFEGDRAIEIDHPDESKVYTFISNGSTYYFNKEKVDELDKKTKKYYELGANISLAIICSVNTNEEQFPSKMTYLPYAAQGASLMGQNTSNKYGFDYYIACIEFINYRHSLYNFEKGYISNYVIGNEIDFPQSYNRISDKQSPIDVYMEEYSRLLRIANLASKKYCNLTTVCMPITHNWGKTEKNVLLNEVQGYAPLDLVEWLNKRSKLQGDFNWGLAPHSYCRSLPSNSIYELDTWYGGDDITSTKGGKTIGMNQYPTNTKNHQATAMITFSNLEVLDIYLHQDNLKVNGSLRPVYLTESGISSCELPGSNINELRKTQAACIALAYYKVSQLESICGFSYYRCADHEIEASAYANFGILDIYGDKKEAYNLWKYIDTQYSEKVANKYLDYLSYYDNGKVYHAKGTVKSYQEILNIFGTDYDFSNFDWTKATPDKSKCDENLEYEDKVDLGNISFDDENYLYDGTTHRKEIKGTLNEGITVEYENNELSDCGSLKATATFKKDGELVGKRAANISVKHFVTNKNSYKKNENIFVTTSKCDDNYNIGSGSNSAWIGIYKSDAEVSTEPSKYWYSINSNDDKYTRTKVIQEGIDNLQGGITNGTYKIIYFKDSGYDYDSNDVIYITISKNEKLDENDISNIKFEDKEINYSGKEESLTIDDNLPDGITVRYLNNTLNEFGKTNAVAIFEKDGIEIERRYAVLSLIQNELSTNKEVYKVGEDILVTAYGKKNYWVGIYLKNDVVNPGEDNGVASIYWYYVIDSNHVSGGTYNIKEQTGQSGKYLRPELVDLPAGEYKIVMFDDSSEDGGYHVNKQIYITIEE